MAKDIIEETLTCSFKPGETTARSVVRDLLWPEQVMSYTARGTSDKFTGESTYDNDRGVHGRRTFTNNDLGKDVVVPKTREEALRGLGESLKGTGARRGKEAIEECNKRRKPDPSTPMA